jgi:hypothetical protein
MRSLFAAFLALLVLAGPAFAAGAEARPEPGTTVEMPFLVAPVSQNGKLLGYVYISSKLICSNQSACFDVREKLAFIQDANVRDVNAQPVGFPNDPTTVDVDRLNARLTANAKRIVGDSKVVRMDFGKVKETIKYAPLHPSESTAGLLSPAPDQAAPGTPAMGSTTPTGQAQAATQSAATPKPPAK